MNARQLIGILIVAAVLGAIGWVLFNRGASSWESRPSMEGAKLIAFPLNDVVHITIKDNTTELNLAHKGDEWVVKQRADYPANFDQVSRLLQKVWELKPVQDVKVGPSQFSRLNLSEPGNGANSGTLLDLKSKDDKRVAALLVGKQYLRQADQRMGDRPGYPAGRYVMPEDGSKRVALVSDPLEDVTTKPERWLNKDFIKVDKPKSITLASQTPAMNWKLTRTTETGPWAFADAKPGEEVDAPKSTGLGSAFGRMSFVDVLDPATKPETLGLDKPAVLTIETFDGFNYSISIGKLQGENYPITVAVSANLPAQRTAAAEEKPDEKKKLDDEFATKRKTLEEKLAKEKKLEGRPYLIAKYAIEQVLKNRADLIKAPPTPTPSPAAPGQLPPTMRPPGALPMRPPRMAPGSRPAGVPPPAPPANSPAITPPPPATQATATPKRP